MPGRMMCIAAAIGHADLPSQAACAMQAETRIQIKALLERSLAFCTSTYTEKAVSVGGIYWTWGQAFAGVPNMAQLICAGSRFYEMLYNASHWMPVISGTPSRSCSIASSISCRTVQMECCLCSDNMLW